LVVIIRASLGNRVGSFKIWINSSPVSSGKSFIVELSQLYLNQNGVVEQKGEAGAKHAKMTNQ